jgi:V-type H+-transporting ATPase subunit a
MLLTNIKERYEGWFVALKKVKSTYFVLNTFNYDVTNSALIGEAWCPVARLPAVYNAMEKVRKRAGNPTPIILKQKITKEQPPTLYLTNKFTNAFQAIVDAYGVASYKEVNPALFTLVSFPFLFGIMFGDVGHGAVMTIFGAWMCIREKSLRTKRGAGEVLLFNNYYCKGQL